MTYIDAKTNKVVCSRCGATAGLPLPCAISDFVDFLRGFEKRHYTCTPPTQPTQPHKES